MHARCLLLASMKGGGRVSVALGSFRQQLVHGWDISKNLNLYFLLGFSTLTNVKCYPTVTKTRASLAVACCELKLLHCRHLLVRGIGLTELSLLGQRVTEEYIKRVPFLV